mgnify:CR=1 FL=1
MKTVIVTGGSRGIGKCIAENLAKEGYNVVLNYNKSVKEAKKTKEELEKQGIKIEIYNSLTDDYDNDIFIRRKYESARDLIYGDILYDRDGFYSGLKEELLNTKKKYLPPYIHTLKLKYKTK